MHPYKSRPNNVILYWYVKMINIILICSSMEVLSIIMGILIKVGYKPNATMNTAHHMLLYGCGEPGSTRLTWYVHVLLNKGRQNLSYFVLSGTVEKCQSQLRKKLEVLVDLSHIRR